MKTKEFNQGYEITERFITGELGYVLGESKTAPAPFVTWCFRADSPQHYFWGRYFGSKEKALENYRERISDELGYLMERTGKPPLLPPLCLTVEPSSGDLINIRRGEHGYYASDWNIPGDEVKNRQTAAVMNRRWGVTRGQEEAMLAGSMFGWDCHAADPRNYNAQGEPQRPKKRDELER